MNSRNPKNSLKPNHGQHSKPKQSKRALLLSFIIFMAWVAGIGFLISLIACQPVQPKPIATDDSSGYYIDLSKNVSDLPSRTLLAFFVPDTSAASQAVSIPSSIAPNTHLSVTRGHSLISTASHLLTDYDGLTLQNKIAVRRICRAVTNVTESKTRHPILLPYSVALTQKTLGGIHA